MAGTLYVIEVKGKGARYATLAAAKRAAESIFAASGIVVGIAEVSPCYCPDDCGCRRFWDVVAVCGCRATAHNR